jgi:hypothetical protein
MSAEQEIELKSDVEEVVVDGINLTFREQLLEAYTNYGDIAAISEQIKNGCSTTPVDRKTYYVAGDGKEFTCEQEAVAHNIALNRKQACLLELLELKDEGSPNAD